MSYVLQTGFAYALVAPGGSKRSAAKSRHLALHCKLGSLVALRPQLLVESLRERNDTSAPNVELRDFLPLENQP